ncbi:MAG TPA: lysyl oxidase family protein [Solirubrobacterales bacterium]|nr:lysyl oxidase family protein [Solirubrobacterales bacterium]
MRARVFALTALAIAAALTATSASAATPAENPCEGPEAKQLLCPNLRIGPASEMYVQSGDPGRVLLRATSDVRSRGRGPMELRGKRNGWRTMTTNQRIYRVGGGHIDVDSDATLRFTDVGDYWGGAYWKVHQLASFDLRRASPDGSVGAVVRTSPKLNYCLRDLERTRPGQRSPANRHYPGCNQNPYRNRVVLGTSVGWSDIYAAPYHQQWIDVAGLRGCFAFEMTVDPEENLFESNEDDNSSRRLVRLPYDGTPGC